MSVKFEVLNTVMSDLRNVFNFFDASVIYQEKHGYPAWREYDQSAIIRDIENKLQYKIIADGEIAIVFSVCYSDKLIWRELEKGDSLYLHRIVVNPECKGHRLFGLILEWATAQAHQLALRSIRMDTWANNPKIIDYYKSFGFRLIENYTTPDTIELPVHNRNLGLSLLELEV